MSLPLDGFVGSATAPLGRHLENFGITDRMLRGPEEAFHAERDL